jgi:hypothetical protein
MSFHVPESARQVDGPNASDATYGNNGAFTIPSCEPGWSLVVIASDGAGWEHVSARATRDRASRIPTWREMCLLKGLYWDDADRVVQYHPPRAEYVNTHPHVLHLWRPTTVELPAPPPILVGIPSAGKSAD